MDTGKHSPGHPMRDVQKCHKKMELYGKGEDQTFICKCGYKEKLSAFKNRREKEGAGVGKRDVQNYLKKTEKKKPPNR